MRIGTWCESLLIISDSCYGLWIKKNFKLCFFLLNGGALNSFVVWLLATEGDRLFQCGIVWGKMNSSGHHCMSGTVNVLKFRTL